MALLVMVIWLGLCAWRLPKLAMIYGILSLILFGFIGKIKKAANDGEWRARSQFTYLGFVRWLVRWFVGAIFIQSQNDKTRICYRILGNGGGECGATIYLLPKLAEWLR